MVQFTIRPAQPSDTAAILALCQTDLQEDNLNEMVWDAWLADQAGVLVVATVDEQQIGTAHMALLNEHEAWFEGAYVAAEKRGRGVGRALLHYCIAAARQQGAEVIRTSIAATQTAAHVLVQHAGFGAVGSYVTCSAPTTGVKTDNRTRPYLRQPDVAMLDTIWQWLEHSHMVTLTGGLLLQNGRGMALTDLQLEQHLQAGHVWTLTEWGQLQGLCIALPYLPVGQIIPHNYTLLSVDGTPEAIGRIAYSLRDIAREMDMALVTAHPPPMLSVVDALSGAGFTRTTDTVTTLFALPLI